MFGSKVYSFKLYGIQIISEYANNTFAISAAIEKMQMKIDSASDEIEKQLEEFEASIDAKSQELEDNLQEQCKKCMSLSVLRNDMQYTTYCIPYTRPKSLMFGSRMTTVRE